MNHVYIAGTTNELRRLKVGISRAPERRLRTFQTANSHEIVMHRIWADKKAKQIEKAAHDILAHCHIRGEWFACGLTDAEAAVRQAYAMVYDRGLRPAPWWKRLAAWVKRFGSTRR